MRYGMRLGRRSWVTGGGGVLIAATISGLMYLTLMVSVWAVVTAIGLLLGLAAYALRGTKSARRTQLAMLLKGGVDDTAPGALDGRTRAWAVYAVGDQFHHGIHPRKGEELLRLYPDRAAQIARVALFADAARARSAAGRLQRHGYSFAELLTLLPNNYTPGHGLHQPASSAPLPKAQRAPGIEATDVVSAESAMSSRSDTPRAQLSEAVPTGSIEPAVVNRAKDQMSTRRDTTKYTFDGQTMGKGRLVLALVKRYVHENPGVTFQGVRCAFPDELQAGSPIQFTKQRCVVARLDDLSSAARKRFHVGDSETIELSDDVIVVSREWNRFNIQHILKRAQELGFAVAVAHSAG